MSSLWLSFRWPRQDLDAEDADEADHLARVATQVVGEAQASVGGGDAAVLRGLAPPGPYSHLPSH